MASAQPDVPDVEQDIAEYSPQKHWGRVSGVVAQLGFLLSAARRQFTGQT